MKVREIPYHRATEESMRSAFDAFFAAEKKATRAEDLLAAREALNRAWMTFYTQRELANYRYNQNVNDAFYQGEIDYYDAIGPQLDALQTKFYRAMLQSPFRKELEQALGSLLFRKYEVSIKAHSEACIADEQEENALVTQYTKRMSTLLFSWEGKQIPLSVLRGKLEDGSAQVRKAAADAIGEGLRAYGEELDTIYDSLVRVRDRIAKKMGYKDFVELGYYRMGRTGFTRAMVEKFRANVVKSVVPVVSRLKMGLKEELGLDVFRFSDNDVYCKGGNPAFLLTIPQAFDAAQTMYDEMDGEIGEFFRSMVAAEAFDVDAREGKCGGGFCDELPDYNQSVILANFNGTTGDVDVLTHEFGHAFAMHASAAAGVDFELGIGGMETAECHSMSMEFLCWPYMENSSVTRRAHIASNILPTGSLFCPTAVSWTNFSITPTKIPWRPPRNARRTTCLWRKNTALTSPTTAFPISKRGRAGSISPISTKAPSITSIIALHRPSHWDFSRSRARATPRRLHAINSSRAAAVRCRLKRLSRGQALPIPSRRARLLLSRVKWRKSLPRSANREHFLTDRRREFSFRRSF